MQQITIHDFLTEAQIEQAQKLYRKAPSGTFASRCEREIITPNMAAINKKLGQENNARYLAYCVEYVFNQASQ